MFRYKFWAVSGYDVINYLISSVISASTNVTLKPQKSNG